MRMNVVRGDGRNHWHPQYDSVREWLDNEAPVDLPSPVDNVSKTRNRRTLRRVRKA